MKKKKMFLLLALLMVVSPITNNSKTNAKEIGTMSDIKAKHLEKLDFYIGSGPMMRFSSYNAVKAYLQQEKVENIGYALSKIIEFASKGIKGTVKISKSGNISFTPCSNCPWPSLGYAY